MAAGAIVAGLFILGGIGAAIFAGGDAPSPVGPTPPDPARPNYLQPVPLPGEGIAWSDVDEAMCIVYESLDAALPANDMPSGQALLDGVLARVWPAVPWPSKEGDHVTVRQVQVRVGERVGSFVNDVQAGIPVCVDAPLPPPPVDPPAPTDISAYFTNKPGGFFTPPVGSNLTAMVRSVYALPAAQSANARRAIACNTQVGFNLFYYSRPREGDDYETAMVNGKWKDIVRAFSPWNQNVNLAAATGEKLLRQIGWSGNSTVMPGGTFGRVWLRPMLRVGNILSCPPSTGPWDPSINPPKEVLAALGYPGGIEEMKAVWDAQNPNA